MRVRVLVNGVVHLVVVRKIARAAREAVDMNVGDRLPGLLAVLQHSSRSPLYTSPTHPALQCCAC